VKNEADREVAQSLRRLATWGTEAVYPVLMVLLDRREDGRAAPNEIISAMLFLESYLVRRMLCGRTASGINRTLAQAALAIAGGGDAAEELRQFLSQPRRFWPDDDQLAESLSRLNFYWTGKASQRLFVLRRLEENYGHKELVDWDETTVQIEHVLPQTPTPDWLDLLEPDVDPGETPADLHERVVHRLGNLTLTGYNPDLSNKPFPEKRALLAMSKFSMSREVAEQDSWGLQQIEARGADLAARAAQAWPGPMTTRVAASHDQWQVVRRVCATLPEGTWTAYGDVSAVAGIHPKPLGNYLGTNSVANAWRVLRSDGSVSSEFRWMEPNRTDAPRDVLTMEGVRFDDKGRADATQRLSPADLASLIGVDVPEEALATSGGDEHRFWIQLAASHPDTQDPVRQLLSDWRARGGDVSWGGGAQVSCFPIARSGSQEYWPWVFKPTAGTVEVVFKHLLIRPPFDDTAVRDELRQRINCIPDVDVPLSRLELRPTFPLMRLCDDVGLKAAINVQAWFINRVPTSEADG
jgi:alkylated DNA nucleotide flippase Atl1